MTLKDVPARGDLDAADTRDVHYAYDNLGRQTVVRFDSLTGEGWGSAMTGSGGW